MIKFSDKKQRNRDLRTLLISFFSFLFIFEIFLLSIYSVSESTARRQRESLEKALDRSVIYCYAVDGEYPASLSYIKENYGLTYDEERFFIDYRYQGGNILPEIMIIDREE